MGNSLLGNITGSKEKLMESVKKALRFTADLFYNYITNTRFSGYKIDDWDNTTKLLIRPDCPYASLKEPAIHSIYCDNLVNMVGSTLKDLYLLDNFGYRPDINSSILTIFRLKHPDNYSHEKPLIIKDLTIHVGIGITTGNTRDYNEGKYKSVRCKSVIAVLASESSKIKFENCKFNGHIGITIIDDVDPKNKNTPYIVPVNINEFEVYGRSVFFDNGKPNLFPNKPKNNYVIVGLTGSKKGTNLVHPDNFTNYPNTDKVIEKNIEKNLKFFKQLLFEQYNIGNVNITQDLCSSLHHYYYPNYRF